MSIVAVCVSGCIEVPAEGSPTSGPTTDAMTPIGTGSESNAEASASTSSTDPTSESSQGFSASLTTSMSAEGAETPSSDGASGSSDPTFETSSTSEANDGAPISSSGTDETTGTTDACAALELSEGDPIVCSGDGTARTVAVANDCEATAIELIWINFDCQEDPNVRFVIDPGATSPNISTFSEHAWRVRALDDGHLLMELSALPPGRTAVPSGTTNPL